MVDPRATNPVCRRGNNSWVRNGDLPSFPRHRRPRLLRLKQEHQQQVRTRRRVPKVARQNLARKTLAQTKKMNCHNHCQVWRNCHRFMIYFLRICPRRPCHPPWIRRLVLHGLVLVATVRVKQTLGAVAPRVLVKTRTKRILGRRPIVTSASVRATLAIVIQLRQTMNDVLPIP